LNHSFEILIQVFSSVVIAHIIILFLLLMSWILEKYAGLKLFIIFFKWEKSLRNAKIYLDGHTILYLLILILTFIITDKSNDFKYNLNTISAFILTIIPLLTLFRKLYSKYQGIDETKDDDELPQKMY